MITSNDFAGSELDVHFYYKSETWVELTDATGQGLCVFLLGQFGAATRDMNFIHVCWEKVWYSVCLLMPRLLSIMNMVVV